METAAFRPLDPADMQAVCQLINEGNAHDGLLMVMDVEELREELSPPALEPATDTRGAFVNDTVVGVAWTQYLPSEVTQERCYVFGNVHPDHRGHGIGQELMEWGTNRADALLKSGTNALPKFIRTQALDGVTDAHRLMARFGLTPVRYFDELVIALTDLAPAPTIDGVSIVAWPAERSDEIQAVKNASFASHWGSTPASDAVWRQTTQGFGARTDLSFVAVDRNNTIVAMLLTYRYEADDTVLGYAQGYIDKVGTLAKWRGRGIASALILTALHRYREVGLTHAALDVDSDSPTGANRLYATIGFVPHTRSITFERSVTLTG